MDRLQFTKIFPANILLYCTALCLYIEDESFTHKNPAKFQNKTFAKFSSIENFPLYVTLEHNAHTKISVSHCALTKKAR